MKIAILCPDFPPDPTGLADHTATLAEHLAAHAEVTVITSQRGVRDEATGAVRVWRQVSQWRWRGGRTVGRLLLQLQPDWLIVQYVPHMYGRGGINLMLPLLLWWWRWRGGQVLLLIHELYLPWSLKPKRLLAAVLQRFMLALSVAAAPRVGVSTDVWRQRLERRFPFWQSRFHHLPTPSNVPVAHLTEAEKATVRQQLGLASDELMLGFFGTLHDSKLMDYVLESLRAVEADGQRARLLCIGPTSQELAQAVNGVSHAPEDRIVCTGYVDARRVSQYLSVTDIFLLPLIDGVSSRRSSLMAALSHGLPVVATIGEGTDRLWLESAAFAGSPVEEKSVFLKNVCALAADEARRRQLAEAGARLYQDQFSWPVVTARLLSLLERDDRT
jgi:glycosyltransferase involved in cell wall biosynthesis